MAESVTGADAMRRALGYGLGPHHLPEGSRMSGKFVRTLIGGLALLAALVAGCSSNHTPTHHHSTHSSAPSGGGGGGGTGSIPQGNQGDHDADNNGGPSDGDGNI